MTTATSALTRAAHSTRRAITRLITRLTRQAEIEVSISVSKLVFDYKADLRMAANDNNSSISPRHSA